MLNWCMQCTRGFGFWVVYILAACLTMCLRQLVSMYRARLPYDLRRALHQRDEAFRDFMYAGTAIQERGSEMDWHELGTLVGMQISSYQVYLIKARQVQQLYEQYGY